jgi:hypothetical protein
MVGDLCVRQELRVLSHETYSYQEESNRAWRVKLLSLPSSPVRTP